MIFNVKRIIIQKIEEGNIKNIQSIVEIIKLTDSPQIIRRETQTRETSV